MTIGYYIVLGGTYLDSVFGISDPNALYAVIAAHEVYPNPHLAAVDDGCAWIGPPDGQRFFGNENVFPVGSRINFDHVS